MYRGTRIDKNEVELWKNNKFPLIMLGFNSSSSDPDISNYFMQLNSNPHLMNVILEIEINSITNNKPVSIRHFSEMKEEEEYLMQLNSFLIVNQF